MPDSAAASGPLLGGAAGGIEAVDEDPLQRWNRQSAFDVQHWYELLREHTFPTAFVPMPNPVGEALIASYRHAILGRAEPTEAQRAALRAFTARLQDECGAMGAGFFVRLGSRSPKDAESATATRSAYQVELARREAEDCAEDGYDTVEESTNAQLRAYFEVAHRATRAGSAEAAMAMLATSERVCRDVERSLEAGVGISVCLRAWEPALRQEGEYRGFVHGSHLTQLTQYNPYVHLPQLVASRDAVATRIADFWSGRIRPLLAERWDAYVVDFAVLQTGAIMVIELNPFDEQTGGGLFRWEDPADRALLEGRAGEGGGDEGGGGGGVGDAPPPPPGLRVVTQPLPRMGTTIEVFSGELRA